MQRGVTNLTRETKATCDSRHNDTNQVVQVTVCGGCEFEGAEANIIQGLVINAHDFIGVFNKLVDGEGSVIWLNDGI